MRVPAAAGARVQGGAAPLPFSARWPHPEAAYSNALRLLLQAVFPLREYPGRAAMLAQWQPRAARAVLRLGLLPAAAQGLVQLYAVFQLRLLQAHDIELRGIAVALRVERF